MWQVSCVRQQKQITNAWYEDMSIVTYVRYDLDFERYAEVDFFGPPQNTASAQKNIRGISVCHIYENCSLFCS